MDPARAQDNGKGTYWSYRKKVIAIALVVVILVAGFSVYYAVINKSPGKRTLVVYTYDSFMGSGINGSTNETNAIFAAFEKEYNVSVVIKTPTNGILQQLVQDKKNQNPQADVVIGLTNMNGVTAVSQGLLVKYTPPDEAKIINSTLLDEMGTASGYITPYEYSYLGIDYNRTFADNKTFEPSFANLTTKTNASNLLLENPTSDDTGQGFLLWEIAYYEYVLKEPWANWWNDTKQSLTGHVYDSWDTAFNDYFNTGGNTNLIVSYLTDPAYYQYFGYGNPVGSAVTYHDGNAYGWRTIYGVGIVNGSKNLQLDEAFVNYILGSDVQNAIPLNEWMYPANVSTPLPAVFGNLTDQNSIIPLNNYINASEIAQNLSSWNDQWLNLNIQ